MTDATPNLCRIDPDGRVRLLTRVDGRDGREYDHPSLSHDGTRLAFAFDGAIHLGGADPLTAPVLAPAPSFPSPSVDDVDLHPTAPMVAFVRSPLTDGHGETEHDAGVADADGIRLVARDTEYVAWLGDRVAADVGGFGDAGHRLCIPTADGASCEHVVLADPRGSVGDPAVSPDGRRIAAVVSNQDGEYLRIFDARTGRVLRRRLFYGGHAGTPAWSPDGRTIAFFYFQGIYLVDVRTGHEQLFASGMRNPTWGGRIGARNPRLRLRSVRVRGRRMYVRGTIGRGVRAPILVHFHSSHSQGLWRDVRVNPRRGRFAATVRGLQERPYACHLVVTFTGDARFHRAAAGRRMKEDRCGPD